MGEKGKNIKKKKRKRTRRKAKEKKFVKSVGLCF